MIRKDRVAQLLVVISLYAVITYGFITYAPIITIFDAVGLSFVSGVITLFIGLLASAAVDVILALYNWLTEEEAKK